MISLLAAPENWAGFAIRAILHPGALILVALGSGIATGSFVIKGFDREARGGIRVLAAALLPLLMVAWAEWYRPDVFAELAQLRWTGGLTALFLGFCSCFVFRFSEERAYVLGAFCSSMVFSILVFGYAVSRDSEIFVLYYGFVVGVCGHLIILGPPKDFYRRVCPAGTFEIRPEGYDMVGLYCNDEKIGAFEDAQSAAREVEERMTGLKSWEKGFDKNPLSKWRLSRQWRGTTYAPKATSGTQLQ